MQLWLTSAWRYFLWGKHLVLEGKIVEAIRLQKEFGATLRPEPISMTNHRQKCQRQAEAKLSRAFSLCPPKALLPCVMVCSCRM